MTISVLPQATRVQFGNGENRLRETKRQLREFLQEKGFGGAKQFAITVRHEKLHVNVLDAAVKAEVETLLRDEKTGKAQFNGEPVHVAVIGQCCGGGCHNH